MDSSNIFKHNTDRGIRAGEEEWEGQPRQGKRDEWLGTRCGDARGKEKVNDPRTVERKE